MHANELQSVYFSAARVLFRHPVDLDRAGSIRSTSFEDIQELRVLERSQYDEIQSVRQWRIAPERIV